MIFVKRLSVFTLLLLLALPGRASVTPAVARADAGQLRIALIGIAGSKTRDNDSRALDFALTETLSRDPRVSLIDQSIVQPALAGIGYDGSINLGKDEARGVGGAIACDFFIAGKTEALTRSTKESESHEEAYAGVMIVDGRTGALAVFDFISEESETREAAVKLLIKTVTKRVRGYIDRLTELREAIPIQPSTDLDNARWTAVERIEDMPEEGSPKATGFTPPEFLNRVKPEYTSEAEQANVTAIVEAMVTFRGNGEIGHVEITRWAGFGLEQSAERAIRQLKFKPATRDGKPISVRAFIRYNFRRIDEPIARPEPASQKPPGKPELDLRQIFKPTYRRP